MGILIWIRWIYCGISLNLFYILDEVFVLQNKTSVPKNKTRLSRRLIVMQGFRPSNYGGTVAGNINTSDRSLHKNANRLVKKGGHDMLKIDVAELESMASNLRRNSHLPVKVLPPDVKKDFRQLLTYVSLLYDTKQYIILHNIVTKHFDDIGEIVPGTIGAYCAGCQVDTSFTDNLQGCSAVCAGSMPPKKDDWNFCNNTVILAHYDDERFIFTISKRSETRNGRETAFIFINYTNAEKFPGFSEDEKNQLRALGIKYVYLNGYTRDGRKYIGLENDVISIDHIKTRDCYVEDYADHSNEYNDSGMIVLLIVVVLIALFFAWRYWQLRESGDLLR